MKALLRSSIVALLVFAGYAAFGDMNQILGSVGRPPMSPCPSPLPPSQSHAALCVK